MFLCVYFFPKKKINEYCAAIVCHSSFICNFKRRYNISIINSLRSLLLRARRNKTPFSLRSSNKASHLIWYRASHCVHYIDTQLVQLKVDDILMIVFKIIFISKTSPSTWEIKYETMSISNRIRINEEIKFGSDAENSFSLGSNDLFASVVSFKWN